MTFYAPAYAAPQPVRRAVAAAGRWEEVAAALRPLVWRAATRRFAGYLAWRYDWGAWLSVQAGGCRIFVLSAFATAPPAPSIGVMTSDHPGALGLDARAGKRSATP